MKKVGPPRIVNVEDLRRGAKLRLPRVVFDYIDGGAEQEFTMRQNVNAFEMITFRPSVCGSYSEVRSPNDRAGNAS
jgi:(S)-mandelate dehydrogenase